MKHILMAILLTDFLPNKLNILSYFNWVNQRFCFENTMWITRWIYFRFRVKLLFQNISQLKPIIWIIKVPLHCSALHFVTIRSAFATFRYTRNKWDDHPSDFIGTDRRKGDKERFLKVSILSTTFLDIILFIFATFLRLLLQFMFYTKYIYDQDDFYSNNNKFRKYKFTFTQLTQ